MKQKHIHFVGIKGVGMAPLALIAQEAGFLVTGSDVEKEFITDKTLRNAGIIPFIGFSSTHISSADLVITTGAHGGFSNEEVVAAKEKKIPVMTQGEAVGVFMKGELFGRQWKGISVTGTHGKTTTTAMIATILSENGVDPSYIIGTGDVGSLPAPGHFGKGDYFVAEADEYITEPKQDKTIKFFWQHPHIAVVTNIEYDHPDVYDTIDDVRDAFGKFADQLSTESTLIVSGDDPEIKKLLHEHPSLKTTVITYGLEETNEYQLQDVAVQEKETTFNVLRKNFLVGKFSLVVSGEHNAMNALAAIIVSLQTGLTPEQIQKGLRAFRGSRRRLEFIGELVTGAKVYDDYAHHPTEIRKTLHTLEKQYPDKNIVCIFQPHTYSRTKKLFSEFQQAFRGIDKLFVVLTAIFPSAREEKDEYFSSMKLLESIEHVQKNMYFRETLFDVVQYINEKKFGEDTVIVTMGAGDIYTIHNLLSFRTE